VPTRTCLAVVLCLGMTPPLRAANPTEPVGPQPSVPSLVEQLGSTEFPRRERADRMLRGLSPAALPQLRAARDHAADPEVRRRLDAIIPILENEALLAPKLVTLHARGRSLVQVFQEITRQTGYKIETFGADQKTYTFQFDRLPLWQALDRVCDAGGLIYMPYYGDGAIHLQPQQSHVPYVCYDGCFRLAASGFQQSRSIEFGQLPQSGGTPQRSSSMVLTFTIATEPKLPLLGAGEPRLEAAYDDLNNSMVPPPAGNGANGRILHTSMRYGGYRSFWQQLQLNLNRPSEKATSVKLLRGTVPLTLLTAEKAEVVTDKLMSAKGKKVKVGGTTFVIEDVSTAPGNRHHLKLSIANESRDAQDNDYTWVNSLYSRIEVLDDKGNKFQSFSTSTTANSPRHVQFEFTYHPLGNPKAVPTKLIYHSWTSTQTQVRFTFKDLPLP
jgi:hypothetical protein